MWVRKIVAVMWGGECIRERKERNIRKLSVLVWGKVDLWNETICRTRKT